MHKGKVKIQSCSDIPFDQPMCHPSQDQDDISAHGCLDWLCFIHAKLFEYVMSILHLANEGSLFSLLDLKSKKECENLHHGHLKHIDHYFAKLITKEFLSRTKYNIINIDLTYKQIFTHFSSEDSRVGLTNPKTIFNKEVPKAFILCSWCLLKSIERLIEFINMVRISFTFKAGWLLHIHIFSDWTI
jgi:hypothetical protein